MVRVAPLLLFVACAHAQDMLDPKTFIAARVPDVPVAFDGEPGDEGP